MFLLKLLLINSNMGTFCNPSCRSVLYRWREVFHFNGQWIRTEDGINHALYTQMDKKRSHLNSL